MASQTDALTQLPEFRNEPYTDFSIPANRKAMEEALEKVRHQLGHEYDLLIGGERVRTTDKLKSLNPARPAEVVGIVQKASPEMAANAIELAAHHFPEWSRTPAIDRVRMLLNTANLIRLRKCPAKLTKAPIFHRPDATASSEGASVEENSLPLRWPN